MHRGSVKRDATYFLLITRRTITILSLACASLVAQSAFAQDRAPVAVPPFAKPSSVVVYTNEPAVVTLSVGGRVVEPLRFFIRKPPRFGVVGEVRRTGPRSAEVTYTPGATASDDSFTFAAQSSDSPVSAAARVGIRIAERPPVIECPDVLDFGTVYIGDSEERDLMLRNTGGGLAAVKLAVNPPWTSKNPEGFSIASGKDVVRRIIFSPADERDFFDRIRIDATASVELRGKGVFPVSWPKEGIIFSPQLRERGKASIPITNTTAAERDVVFSWPEGWRGPGSVTIGPGQTAAVEAEFFGRVPKILEGMVGIQSGRFKSALPFMLLPIPPRLVAAPEPPLVLSDDGQVLRGRVVIKNTGETDALLTLSAPEGVLVTPDPSLSVLSGGSSQEFEISLPRNQGSIPGAIVLRPRGGDPLELGLATSPRTAMPASHPSNPATMPVKHLLEIPGTSSSTELPPGNVPPVLTASLISSLPHELTIAWPPPSPDASGYKIQRRQLSAAKDAQINVEWVDWKELKIQVGPELVAAHIHRLPANSFWTIRIIALDAAGQPGPPSPAFRISTPPAPPTSIPPWVWLVLIAAVAAAAGRVAVIRRRQVLAQEDARLARLQAE